MLHLGLNPTFCEREVVATVSSTYMSGGPQHGGKKRETGIKRAMARGTNTKTITNMLKVYLDKASLNKRGTFFRNNLSERKSGKQIMKPCNDLCRNQAVHLRSVFQRDQDEKRSQKRPASSTLSFLCF
jgi:hypothetical protein